MKTNFIKTLFVTLFLLSVNIVNAHDFVSNGIYYNITNATNKKVAVTYKGTDYDSYPNEYTGSVVIPESVRYNGKVYSVTSIGNSAFDGCSGLTSITIPNSVTSIGNDAFDGTAWYNNQPDGVVYAGNVLYEYKGTMPSNTSVVVKDGTLGIANYAFSGCSGLTSIEIPNSVTSIGYRAFYCCTKLTGIEIPNSVTSIGNSAFYGCKSLTSITIPNSITSIGGLAFDGCSGLKEVHINDIAAWCSIDFSSWESNPLYYAHNLYLNNELITELVIPNGVTSIGNSAFYNCSSLASITIPNSVTSIGNSAFRGCSGLTSVTIGNSVTSIGNYAFFGCKSLTSIVIPNSVTSIGNQAFDGCSGLTSIIIGNSVTSIGISAFSRCSGLTSITIPNSVTSIGERAFSYCSNLKTVINLSNLTFSKGSSDYGYVAYYADKVINTPGDDVVGDFVFSTVDDKHTLAAYFGDATDVTLPGDYNGENYAIGDYLFITNKKELTSIVIPNSVTSIGYGAFEGCTGLTSITIPNSVTSIGNSAFYDCYGLKSVTIGNGVISIGNSAFSYCDGLTSIEIPNSVTNIGNYAFYSCDGFTSITIPNSVTSIGERAFSYCSNLKTVINLSNLTFSKGSSDYGYVAYYANKVINAPGGDVVGDFVFSTVDDKHTLVEYLGNATDVTLPSNYNGENYAIGDYLFITNKKELTSIVIPNSVTSIGYGAFEGCTGLTSVTIPNSVTSIGEGAFSGCTKLGSVVIGNSVISIGNSAFSYCDGLTSITIPNSVTSIGYRAFYDCYGLKSVTIGNGVTSIGDYAFYGCKGLETVVNLSNLTFSKGSSDYGLVAYYANQVINGVLIGDFVFSTVNDKHTLVAYLGDATDVTLPGNYNGENYAIGDYLFIINRKELTSIEIPNSVTSIGDSAFSGCSGLTSIIIPNSVTSIGYSAFSVCSGLTSIIIPNSVTSIENYAFSGCKGLKSVTIGNGVTSIGSYAFSGCKGLTSIEIPNSVTSIGYDAFYGCSGLTSIVIPNSVTSIGEEAFYNCSGLKEVHINDLSAWCSIDFGGRDANPLCYADNLYLNSESVTDLVIPNDVKEIKDYAFYNCSCITSVTIGNGVTSIGDYAFYKCKGLTSIIIPNSVTSIGSYAFYNCKGLTSIIIPNSVTSIGSYAFSGCYGLTSIEIPNSVTSIGSYAFPGCWRLTSVTIPNSVTSIGDYAFHECKGLTSIEIPNSVTSIGEGAFVGCKGLKTVINLSNLTFSKGSSDYGYVAYYANKVINAPGGDVVGDFVFFTSDGKHTLAGYLGNETEITLPDNYNGKNYAIGDNVFKNNSSITSITIPNSVTSIGDAAFSGCSSLTNVTIGKGVINTGGGVFVGCPSITTITLLGEIPPVIINTDDDYEYDFTPQQYETVVLYVPEGSLDVYKSAYVWKEFFNIKEFDNTGIENLEAGSFNGLSDVYYDLNGCIVDNPTKGIYIINGKKVLVK